MNAPRTLPMDRVPIVFAVTGHRDIPVDDVAKLSAVVSQRLKEVSAQYPHSPCLLLSALAEGADRLVARCALASGWHLGAVLPMPQREYEEDFADQSSVAEFRDLVRLAAFARTVVSDHTSRPQCYVDLGDWLAQHAQVLVALWDGQPGQGPGGTAAVVQAFREGVPSDKLIIPDVGPVVHVQTRRARNGEASGVPTGQITDLPPLHRGLTESGEMQRWATILSRIDRFNQDVAHAELPAPVLEQATSDADGGLSKASALYQLADGLSMAAQKERDQLFKGLLALSTVAIALAQVYSSMFSIPVLLGIGIAMSLAGFGWHFVVSRRYVEQRYLDYRSLAEACKVQHFWQRAGVDGLVAEHFLREQKDELEWIRQAVITTRLQPTASLDHAGLQARLVQIRTDWIDDQMRYFIGDGVKSRGKADFNRRKDELWSSRSRALFISGMLLALATAAFHAFAFDAASEVHTWLLRAMTLGYSVIFAAAGLCKVFQENRAFAEHAKQYERMGLVFQLARTKLDAALASGDLNRAVEVVRALGIEALSENGDWLLMHRDRPVSAQGIG